MNIMGFFNSLMGKAGNSTDLASKIQAGAKVVDVRSKAEFNDGHHPKATNIPLDALQARIAEFGPKDKCIIVYCASGGRSAMAARLLKEAGYADVINAGGLSDMPN
jgi:phage shock protein E